MALNGKGRRDPARGKTDHSLNLADSVKLWPTPRASCGNGARRRGRGGEDLQTAVLWPTPRTAGMCGGTGNWARLKEKAAGIEEARGMGAGNGGRLNPGWVEALMGYPQGWTDIGGEADMESGCPARWLDGTWEEGTPRVVSGVENRARRLRCLGNAIVPQIAMCLWRLIKEAFEYA